MSSILPELRHCRRCAAKLAPQALVCDGCQALVHGDLLDRLAAEAKSLESSGDLRGARDRWLEGLPMLPRSSKQYAWIENHTQALDRAANKSLAPPPPENNWAKRLGPLGTLAVILAKGKTILFALLKFKFLFSFVAFLGIYWAAFGMKFGVGFACLILLHEMGHFIDIKRRGLPAEMPVFLPGLGAYVRWEAMGVPQETRSAISLAGPLAGLITAVVCASLWFQTGNPLWGALARVGAALNLLNLIPVWMLDGGHAVQALGKAQRFILLGASLGLWFALRQNMFLLVAIGAAYQAFFVKDLPERPSNFIAFYYLGVMAALGVLMHFMPGQGLAAQ